MTEPEVDPDARPGESIGFRRALSLPGLEVLDAVNTAHRFNWFHTGFGIGVPITWLGEIRYRGRQATVGRGEALCAAPGEMHTMPQIHVAGTFNALMVEEHVFADYAAEHGIDPRHIEWRILTGQISPRFAQRFTAFLRVLAPEANGLELQSSLVDLFEAVVGDLVAGNVRAVAAPSPRGVRRIREILHSEDGERMDLEQLAAEVGMTRFQALRAFKRRYGLPPHAYRVATQLAAALPLLRSGHSAADVAAACGFADQSHFGRAFKRLFGLTPGQYAKSGRVRRTFLETSEPHV